MRRVAQFTPAVGTRAIVGVAPVLHFPQTEAKLPRDKQIERNTNIALELTKRFRGPVPAPYKRRHTQTIEQIEKEIETLLGGAEKLRKPITDEMSMDKLTLMERCLRHGLWSYLKEEGKYNFPQMEKWLVYTTTDEQRLSQLKRQLEQKEKYAAFRQKRKDAGLPDAPLPESNWAAEYAAATDREVVSEKRWRYDALAANTTERDESKLAALDAQYRKSAQDERLDKLVDLLEQFKPVLAREAIMQRLTVKHLEGQLAIWRYLDWNPNVRDRCELEMDSYAHQYWQPGEERRLALVRMKSKAEVAKLMEAAQNAKLASKGSKVPQAGSVGGKAAERERLLQEVLALQARLNKKVDDVEAPKAEEKKKGHH